MGYFWNFVWRLNSLSACGGLFCFNFADQLVPLQRAVLAPARRCADSPNALEWQADKKAGNKSRPIRIPTWI